MEIQLIENILTRAYGLQIIVRYNEDEQDYRAYLPQPDIENLDSDAFEVLFFKHGEFWRIAYWAYNPGVWMRSDGSGEPPSWDDMEVDKDFKTMSNAVEYWARYIFDRYTTEAIASQYEEFQ